MIDWTKLLTNKWMNNPTFLAQIAHVLGAYAIVLSAAFLGNNIVALVFAGLLIAYAAVKEFWYDANYELPKQTTFDNVLDFSMYMVGIVLSLLVIFLIH